MTEFSSYTHGTPCWVTVTSPDLDKTIAFYGGLFGWEAERDPRPEAGGYTMFKLRGKLVAAASRPQEEGITSHWKTYIASDDVDATAAKIREAGGTVLADPFVFDSGRMTVAQDPTGATFGVWQAGTHHGAQLANEPGSFQWNECETRDVAAAEEFYKAVFGYGVEQMDMGQAEPYRLFMLGDHRVAGLFKITPEMGDDVPPNWMSVFAVADCDASAARATELGGEVLFGPQDIAVGRFAVVQDPTGAVFQIVAAPPTP